MSSKDFVQFLKGFVMACGESGPSQDQWHTLVTMIKAIEDPITSRENRGIKQSNDAIESSDTPNPYQSRGVPEWLKTVGTKLSDNVKSK